MRDALSIMDQAIASAPVENGRAVLSAAQIRELMGRCPTLFSSGCWKRWPQGQSAELMEQLNVLINAGHSPSSLARQMVRYLRNTLMAKLGGEQTELLQISADERARVSRTAMLFSEEEITRNLQIVLRTFDDLNYRQEQRFHLELGLLKLIHAQRLLPIEELLSSVAGGVAGGGGRLGAPRTAAAATAARPAPTPAPKAPAPPSASPFAPSGSWSSGSSIKQSAASAPIAERTSTIAAAAEREVERPMSSAGAVTTIPAALSAGPPNAAAPFPASSVLLTGYAETAAMTDGALAKAPEPAPAALPDAGLPDIDTLRLAIVAALAAAGHSSAAELMRGSAFALEGAIVRIEVPGVGKKMLSLTVNAAAEKIIRQELQRLGAPSRFLAVPGGGSALVAAPSPAAPAAGSIQEAALTHPMVERAREIFHAEVRSVVDLRQK